jgi:hypothetical protein
VWDLDGSGGKITQMGVAIANQKNPGEADSFAWYFRNRQLTTSCGGGTVFLAATAEKLLLRMKEACNGQSLSVLDWRGTAHADALAHAQLLLLANPGTGMRELLLGGGAAAGAMGDFEPKWKQEYEQAKAAMRKEGEKVFATLPIIAYSGAASGAETVRLQGTLVSRGGAK